MRVITYGPDNRTDLPVYGAGSDIADGALLKVGPTAGTDNCMLIPATGASACPNIVGILKEMHDYSVVGDTLIAGTKYVTHPVDLVMPVRLIRAKFSLASLITCTQAVSTTTMTVASLEDNIDGAFLYVVSGLGKGQTNYLTASASGSCTLKAAFGTSLDTTSKFIKILPKFHGLMSMTSDGVSLASQDAAGAVTGLIVNTFIVRNGREEALDPTKHADLTGLHDLGALSFEADLAIRDTAVYTID